ncbi:MAG: LPS export ABC transporter periplasmic protein LptC [Pseudomonadota bacterium]
MTQRGGEVDAPVGMSFRGGSRLSVSLMRSRLIGVVVWSVLAAVAACSPGAEPPKAANLAARMSVAPGVVPDVMLDAVELTEVRHGVKQWHLKAARIEYERAGGLGHLSQVEATFYPDSGGAVLVRSQQGTFDSRARQIELFGQVEVTASPYRLHADRLRYSPKERTLTAPGPARLECGAMTIAGSAVRFELQGRRLSIGRQVRARLSRGVL